MNVQRIPVAAKIGHAQRNAASDWLVQLAGGLAFGAILPFWIFSHLADSALGPEPFIGYWNVLFGALSGVIIGQYFYSRFVIFPGARASSYVLPTFATTFGVVLAGFFFFRLDYGRIHFAASFATCLLWYYACHFITARARQRRLGIVPVGASRQLQQLPHIDWVTLNEDQLDDFSCDGIVADFRADIPDHWERFIAETAIAGVPVYHFKQIQESITGRVDIEHLSENNFGSLIPGTAYLKLKQGLDWVTALGLGILLLPALIVVALAVKFTSHGPIFFCQPRMGYSGRAFTIYKFRTMRHDEPQHGSRSHAITLDADDRITSIGRFLRRSRIDELPQIINILRGEMSWIGPRPEAVPLSAWYEQEIPFYRYRHIVRPGITGWAQVNQGHVAEIEDVHAKLQFDFYYIKYFSPWLDVLIVLRTVRTVLTGFGSK